MGEHAKSTKARHAKCKIAKMRTRKLYIGKTVRTLRADAGATQGEFQLSAYRGKNVVIAFYALDFTPV